MVSRWPQDGFLEGLGASWGARVAWRAAAGRGGAAREGHAGAHLDGRAGGEPHGDGGEGPERLARAGTMGGGWGREGEG